MHLNAKTGALNRKYPSKEKEIKKIVNIKLYIYTSPVRG